jgi:CelD/BcsL family acetyltransferase involved in cellulose biosynthesis
MLSAGVSVLSHKTLELGEEIESCEIDDPRWLRFIENQGDATVFHHPAWSRLLVKSYGHRAYLLVQPAAGGEITAGLPVLEMRGWLGRARRLRALPFTDHCPPLALTPHHLRRFANELVRWKQAQAVQRLTVHGELPDGNGIELANRALRHVLPLDGGAGALQEQLRGGPIERAIRKAQRQRVQVRISRSLDDLELFYRLHLLTRRRLGVPVQPHRFIRTLWTTVLGAGLGFVVVASHDGAPIAASLFLAWNGNLIYKYGASDARYWGLRPNQLVIWTAIEWACRRGYRLLDLGRTDFDNRGLRDFKNRWGAVEQPLVYSYLGGSPSSRLSRAPMKAVGRLIRGSPPIVGRLAGEAIYRVVMGSAG